MTDHQPCGLLRRLAAALYDAIIVVALLFIATVPVVLVTGGAMEDSLAFRIGLRIYLLAVAFAFFGGFWHFGGQTLGMRSWRVRVVHVDGTRVGWREAAIRFGVAILSWAALGLGFLWSLVDRDCRTWHDVASGTRLIRSP